MEHIKAYIKKRAKNKKIGIFGTGTNAEIAVDFLNELKISEYVFFDNDAAKIGKTLYNKNILSPAEITWDYFILVSTIYYRDIEKQLNKLGMEDLENFIWVLDLKFYDSWIRWKDAPKVPDISLLDIDDIEQGLKEFVQVEEIQWFDEEKFREFEDKLGFQDIYDRKSNRRYRRKIMEYYCVDKILDFEKWNDQDIYLDVGAAGSPYAKYLRENKKIMAFALDLEEGNYSKLPYYIREDATKMHFKDNEVAAISLQSSFEMFLGNSDMDFVMEASRVLKANGKVVICPLYMHQKFLSTVSPNYYNTGLADLGALECIRLDCRGNVPLGRFYSIKALNERIIKTAKKCGLIPKVYSLPQEKVEKDGFVYLKFLLSLEKPGIVDK